MRHTLPHVGTADVTPRVPATTDFSRRRFLFALGASSAGAAAAAAASPALATVAAEPVAATASSGYRETAHVRNYYDTTRL
jgi:hypothetical protein